MDDLVVTAHDGFEPAVRDHGGEGPDVVFVHGVTRMLEDWGDRRDHSGDSSRVSPQAARKITRAT